MDKKPALWGVSRNTLALGWVSFFTDLASEMVYAILPLYMVNVLGINKSLIGLIEGIAESTASLLKIVSGWIADRTGHFKWLVGLGYGISAVGRPFFALASTPWAILLLRFTDRVGKGVRTAPRDALIVATSPPELIGRAFGVHRTIDQMGAIVGPGLAMLLLSFFHGHYHPVFLVAAVPGFIAVWLIVAKVQDVRPEEAPHKGPPRLRWSALDLRLKLFIVTAFVFALGNSSNAFLILRVQALGVPSALVPLTYLLYNLIYVLISIPAGVLSDRIGRPALIVGGYLAFALAYAGFGAASLPWHAWVLFASYGLFSGLVEGVERAWIGDLAPERLRGSAYGVFHFAVGVAAFPASLLTGHLWDRYGAPTAFYVDAGLALVAIGLFGLSMIAGRRARITT